MARPEIRGYIGKNGHGQWCFFSGTWADGVPIPETTSDDTGIRGLLAAIDNSPVRAPRLDELEAIDAPRRCRECGCTEMVACVRDEDDSSACGWAQEDLCTACVPDAEGWDHPPREKTDADYARLAGLTP